MQIVFLCVIHMVIQKSNVRAGSDVLFEKFIVVLRIYHIARRDNDILLSLSGDDVHVLSKCRNICIIYIIGGAVVREQKLELTLLGVDVE